MEDNQWKTPKKRLKRFLKKLAPYALHLLMVVSVAAYVVVGALTIRRIEATTRKYNVTDDDRSNRSEGNVDTVFVDQNERSLKKRCIVLVLRNLDALGLNESENEEYAVNLIDGCYGDVDENKGYKKVRRKRDSPKAKGRTTSGGDGDDDELVQWSAMDSILFCFTVITTIGYGNVAPQTIQGRLFVIVYGLIGIPFSMLAIANLGKFLAELLKQTTKPMLDFFRRLHKRRMKKRSKEKEVLVSLVNDSGNPEEKLTEDELGEKEGEEEEEIEVATWGEALMLFVAFVAYIIIGSVVISMYEPEMDFFGAIYFNFVSLTTVGLGDLVPKNETYLLFTLVYCAVGLALTTIAIEIAADYLKKLHYFGRKVDNVASVNIWFGGKKLTMKQLVKNLGDQFNLPVGEINDLNLDNFVDAAIRVEAGELTTLRQPTPEPILRPIFVDSDSLIFVDEDELYRVPSKPALELLVGQPASRTNSPLVIINEYAAFTPSVGRAPRQCVFDETVRTPSISSISELCIDAPPMTGTSYTAFPDPRRLEQLLLQYVPPKRDTLGVTLDGKTIRKYSQEAIRRYEEYRQEWKKFRTTQNL